MSTSDSSVPDAVLVQSTDLIVRKGMHGDQTCYRFQGRSASLDQSLRDELLKVQEDAKKTTGDLLLDASELEYANSTLVGTLATFLGVVEERGARAYLIGAQKQLCDLLDMLGILGGFEQADSVEAALDASRAAGS